MRPHITPEREAIVWQVGLEALGYPATWITTQGEFQTLARAMKGK